MAKKWSKWGKQAAAQRGGYHTFMPDIEEWREAVKTFPYNTQISKHFNLSKNTLTAFIDREHYKEEKDSKYKSEYLEIYKKERERVRKIISNSFLKNVLKGDTASIIFGMKTFNGIIEAKDLEHIHLKQKEYELKSKAFLTDLAAKFSLDYEQLKDFASKYFSNEND